MSFKNGTLRCDMENDCESPVTHIDDKGYAYCETHGLQRRYYRPCRKLRPHEVKKLQRGEALARY
jgi:hypothetical protein